VPLLALDLEDYENDDPWSGVCVPWLDAHERSGSEQDSDADAREMERLEVFARFGRS